jgi:GrpB-like predicted nucleotidyltransferase (UPF0157 family)
VIIVEYDPRWPQRYEAEKTRLLAAVGDLTLAIEHIGSTAVPGLAAKPIIDMLAGVRDRAAADECVARLQALGYDDVTPEDDPEWFYCLGRGAPSEYHLHIAKHPSAHWDRHIAFRDHLRADPQALREYGEMKKRLAAQFGRDRAGYSEAKSAFIQKQGSH